MSRPLRHVQPGGSTFEVTTRCLQGRYLLPATAHFASIAVGILARARERYPVKLYAVVAASNHMHLLLGVDDAEQLARFMGYVNGNLAREAGRLVDWRERFWGRRYRAIEVSGEAAALVGRLRYLLSHGPKENLVLRCGDWPGLHSARALSTGEPLNGHWRDRSTEYEAARRGHDVDPDDFITHYELELDPLPCWMHLEPDEVRKRVGEMVGEIDTEAAQRVVLGGVAPLGAKAVRSQNPHSHPPHSKRSPAPAVHAASKRVREQMKAAYRLFEAAYHEAAERLKAGDLSVRFPVGCFPPARPFVRSDSRMPADRAGPAWAPG